MTEWIKHDGKGAPNNLAYYVIVEVKYRDGTHGQSKIGLLDSANHEGSLWWDSLDYPEDDIIEYRVAPK